MEKKGCPKCGRHPEEKAPTCPECGLEMPTKSHRRVLISGWMRKAERQGLTLGLALGITMGLSWTELADLQNLPWLPLILSVASIALVIASAFQRRALRLELAQLAMRSRWTRWLPGFPAVLFMIAILGLWMVPVAGMTIGREHYLERFLANLAFALAAAYVFAMAMDRLIFPALRRAQRKGRGPEQPP